MLVGGALAGLGGLDAARRRRVQAAARLPAPTYGYIGFLASWLARHKPAPGGASPPSCSSAIAIGGDSLQIDSGLPAATVNILMALVLLAVFGFGTERRRCAA